MTFQQRMLFPFSKRVETSEASGKALAWPALRRVPSDHSSIDAFGERIGSLTTTKRTGPTGPQRIFERELNGASHEGVVHGVWLRRQVVV